MSVEEWDETDLIKEWEYKGILCRIYINPLYALNGYCQVPEKYHDALNNEDYSWEYPLTAPGGITYGLDEDGWIGFDTVHSGDIWSLNDLKSYHEQSSVERGFTDPCEVARRNEPDWSTHWTKEKVIEETERLAEQINNLEVVEEIQEKVIVND